MLWKDQQGECAYFEIVTINCYFVTLCFHCNLGPLFSLLSMVHQPSDWFKILIYILTYCSFPAGKEINMLVCLWMVHFQVSPNRFTFYIFCNVKSSDGLSVTQCHWNNLKNWRKSKWSLIFWIWFLGTPGTFSLFSHTNIYQGTEVRRMREEVKKSFSHIMLSTIECAGHLLTCLRRLLTYWCQ